MKLFRIVAMLLLLAISIWITNCTGVNVLADYGYPNTNPTPKYAYNFGGHMTGLLFHTNSNPGPISAASIKKTGEACAQSILGLAAFGDASIAAASKAGSIQKIGHVEYKQTAFLGAVYHQFCTTVGGE